MRATFLMSTYNAGPYLRPALDSILAQTVEDWRLIAVDDGSSDGTRDVLAEYGSNDTRVRVELFEQNRGQTAALNHGLSLVETEWVARLDQDDLAAPERVERQLAYLEAHPDVVAVGSWCDYVDDSGHKIGEFHPPSEPDEVLRQLYSRLEHNPLAHSAMTYRADDARAVGGYPTDLSYAQDTALWLLLAARGRIANVPEPLVRIRTHSGQTSVNPDTNRRQMSETLVATDDLPRTLGLEGADLRAWRHGRVRVKTHLAIAAAVQRQPGAAREWGRLLREVAAHPSTASGAVAVIAEGFRHRAAALSSGRS
ncbi:MAG: glycosyltransferase [Thermoleophilaceae bacterium]